MWRNKSGVSSVVKEEKKKRIELEKKKKKSFKFMRIVNW